jgi:predicted dehydrogenase
MKKKLRGALLGAGQVTQYHLQAWSQIEEAEIVAIYNRTLERGQERARQFGIPQERVYGDYERLLDNHQLDFVDVASAPVAHRVQVQAAARRGLHVLCQKPLATSMQEARTMAETCRQAGVLLSVNENWRWRSWYRHVKEILDRDEIGRPHYFRFYKHTDIVLRGPQGAPPHLLTKQPYTSEMDKLIVFEGGTHLIDVLRFLGGEIRSVHARMDRLNADFKGEDRALMSFGLKGAMGVIDISWSTVSGPSRRSGPDSQLERVAIEGEYGTLELLPERGDTLRVSTKEACWERPAVELPPMEAYQASYTAAQRHFVKCLLAGVEPETSAADNLKTLAVTFAAYRSAASDQVVSLE